MRLEEFQHIEIKLLGSIKEDDVDLARRIRQRLQGIADAKLNPFVKPGGGEVPLCPLRLVRIKLGSDHLALSIVADRGRQKDRRDSKGRAKLNDGFRLDASSKAIKQMPKPGADWHIGLSHSLVKTRSALTKRAGPLGLPYAPEDR